MRICIISHSLIHKRQALFCEALQKQGHEVLEIFPAKWGTQEREGGFEIKFLGQGGMAGYFFPPEAETFEEIKKFHPNIIYSQTEWWQVQSEVSLKWAKQLKTPIAFFFWENLRRPMDTKHPLSVKNSEGKKLIKEADLVICGNGDCRQMVQPHNPNAYVMPQVGINCSLFKPLKIKKRYDLVFAANRKVPEKGGYVVEELAGKGYKTIIPMGTPYEKMPEVYNKARLHLCLSYEKIGVWKEQFAPFCNIEAMACGLPTLTTDSGAIKEWLTGCKAATFIPEQWSKNKETSFIKDEIERILWKKYYKKRSKDAREFALQFDNQKVAKELVKVFEKAI